MLAPFPDSPNASWLNIDIAIEIINRMIAEQMKGLYEYCSPYKEAGVEYSNTADYQVYISKIKGFQKEMDSLYKGENLNKVLDKVEKIYAPYIKNKSTQNQYA